MLQACACFTILERFHVNRTVIVPPLYTAMRTVGYVCPRLNQTVTMKKIVGPLPSVTPTTPV